MILSFTLIAIGVGLSAFFSGSETGFYRVTRVRLVMDAKSGKVIARSLLWLVGHPTVVVATVLIGNNLANYLVSLGLLLASHSLLSQWGERLQTFLPVLATPLLFVYGELLPKYLYYNAPYRLSILGAPIIIFFAVVFSPVSCIVIGLSRLWQRILGSENVSTKFSLERQELQRVMMEGQAAGLLLAVQREMAQNLFTYGVRPVRQFVVPLRAIPTVSNEADLNEIFAVANRLKQKFVGVVGRGQKELLGCYHIADLIVDQTDPLTSRLRVCRVQATESAIHVLTLLQSQQCLLAQVVDNHDKPLGVVSRDRLMSLMLPER